MCKNAAYRLARQGSFAKRHSGLAFAGPAWLPPGRWIDLFTANGLQPMTKWNGVGLSALNVGVPAPVNAPVITGIGNIGGPLARHLARGATLRAVS